MEKYYTSTFIDRIAYFSTKRAAENALPCGKKSTSGNLDWTYDVTMVMTHDVSFENILN